MYQNHVPKTMYKIMYLLLFGFAQDIARGHSHFAFEQFVRAAKAYEPKTANDLVLELETAALALQNVQKLLDDAHSNNGLAIRLHAQNDHQCGGGGGEPLARGRTDLTLQPTQVRSQVIR